jgi:hypothetical protein
MKGTERYAPVAAVVTAVSTLACCLPLGFAGGAAALGLGVVLAQLRPWLLGLALILLAVGLIQLSRGSRSCRRRSPGAVAIFVVCTAIVLAIIVFPQEVAGLMAAIP